MSRQQPILMQGNEACALGAIRAGMTFYSGYPITPSSEIAEECSIHLPKHGGRFIQMEDEIAGMAAALGGALTGAKVMTATSGPGFSLKQELIGYGMIAEIPCVLVNIMRMGPSTGLPTSPAQGDVMQAKWGTHGDHPVICLCPTSVKEMYELTIEAFNLAERFRTIVMVLTDEVIAHMREGVLLKDDYPLVHRKRPDSPPGPDFLPYKADPDTLVPPMADYGQGYRFHTTGLAHTENGFPSNSPRVNEALIKRICAKVDKFADELEMNEFVEADDCEHLIIAYAATARAAKFTVRELREKGVKAGLMIPKMLWPFPKKALNELLSKNVKSIFVPEMNMGQYVHAVREEVAGRCPVYHIDDVSGELFGPHTIGNKIMEVTSK